MWQCWECQNCLWSQGGRVCRTPNASFSMSWRHAGMQGKSTEQLTNGGGREGKWSLSLLRGVCGFRRPGKSRDARPRRMPVLPTCSASPRIAAHMGHVVWVLLPVFGGAHVFTAVSVDCNLQMKNWDIITLSWPTPETAGQKEEFFSPKSLRYLITSGHRTQQMLLVSGKEFYQS